MIDLDLIPVEPEKAWTQDEALVLCVLIESICPKYGCHVALTGGLLYKDGLRKDCDILFYRIRQEPFIRWDDLFIALEVVGFKVVDDFGWCKKLTYRGKNIDAFDPEAPSCAEEFGYSDEPLVEEPTFEEPPTL